METQYSISPGLVWAMQRWTSDRVSQGSKHQLLETLRWEVHSLVEIRGFVGLCPSFSYLLLLDEKALLKSNHVVLGTLYCMRDHRKKQKSSGKMRDSKKGTQSWIYPSSLPFSA